MMWLAETPTCVVQACLTMLPRLEAEESLLATTRTAIGSGTAGDSAAAVQREWTARIGPGPQERQKPTPSVLAEHGFAVRRVPRAKR